MSNLRVAGRYAAAVLLVPLAGCLSPDDGGSICSGAFSARESFVLPGLIETCPGCEYRNLRAAIDGELGSGAQVTFNASGLHPEGGEAYLTAFNSVFFEAGSVPGFYARLPAGTFGAASIRIQTADNGESRETLDCSAGSESCTAVEAFGQSGVVFIGGPATQSFDQVEIYIDLAASPDPQTFEILEICGSR